MRSSKVLEMINSGRIEELKSELRDEIYAEALKNKPGAKKRYSAMKKYFSYIKSAREVCNKPCILEFEGKPHTSFCNSYSLVLTSEPCGEIELFTDIDRYPNMTKLVKYDGYQGTMNLGPIFAKAHSLGYKLTKAEVGNKYKYLLHYNDTYFKVGLVESAFNIIDDGNDVTLYHADGKFSSLIIKNDIGVCVIMPIRIDELPEDVVVIEMN